MQPTNGGLDFYKALMFNFWVSLQGASDKFKFIPHSLKTTISIVNKQQQQSTRNVLIIYYSSSAVTGDSVWLVLSSFVGDTEMWISMLQNDEIGNKMNKMR